MIVGCEQGDFGESAPKKAWGCHLEPDSAFEAPGMAIRVPGEFHEMSYQGCLPGVTLWPQGDSVLFPRVFCLHNSYPRSVREVYLSVNYLHSLEQVIAYQQVAVKVGAIDGR